MKLGIVDTTFARVDMASYAKKEIEGIKRIYGIGEKKFELIKDYLTTD